MAMRLGFFGGSFDPPHRGHVAIAQAAANAFALERILFAPTGRQPLKPAGARASFADRLKMVSLVSLSDPRFVTSELDAPRSDGMPNYTVDALEQMRRSFPGAEIYTVIGADSFQDFPHWHQAGRLLELSDWIVVSRPGFRLEEATMAGLSSSGRERIHRLETVMEDVSATEIRRRLSVGDPCDGLLDPLVFHFIAEKGLYGFCSPNRW